MPPRRAVRAPVPLVLLGNSRLAQVVNITGNVTAIIPYILEVMECIDTLNKALADISVIQ